MTYASVMRLTHRQLHERLLRLEKVERRREATMELMMGQVIAMVANTGFKGFEKPREAKEFMPSLRRTYDRKRLPRRIQESELRRCLTRWVTV